MKAILIEIAYRYRGFDYLVADKFGNLYLIPHFRFRRTVYFKKLEPFPSKKGGKKNMIKYHESNISFRQLKERKKESNETIEVY
jgi:hypothetical protein